MQASFINPNFRGMSVAGLTPPPTTLPASGPMMAPPPMPAMPQPQQPGADLLSQIATQYATQKQQQNQQGGFTQAILAQRLQPTGEDASRAALQTAQSFAEPEMFKPQNANQAAQARVGNELAPFTTSLGLQGQVADINLKNAQAYMAGGGMFNQGGGAAPSGGSPAGDPYLATLPPQIATQVKALAEGRMQFPSGFALKTPYWQQMLQAVATYDPNFDAVNYNSRAKVRTDFTSGKSAQSINGLNTVIGHLKNLSDAADGLNNSSVPLLNTVANAAITATGDPRVQQFDTTKKAVVDELTRVYRGSGGSEGDIKTWSDQINAANSPEQLHSVIATIGDLLESKVNALGEQYKQGLGTTSQPIRLMTPAAEQSLNTLRQRAGITPPMDQGAPPAPGQSAPSFQEGQTATNPQTGQKKVFTNGVWQLQ